MPMFDAFGVQSSNISRPFDRQSHSIEHWWPPHDYLRTERDECTYTDVSDMICNEGIVYLLGGDFVVGE